MIGLVFFFLALIVVGLLIQVLSKAAGDKGSESLGAGVSSFGKAGCGCLAVIVIFFVLLFPFMSVFGPSDIF